MNYAFLFSLLGITCIAYAGINFSAPENNYTTSSIPLTLFIAKVRNGHDTQPVLANLQALSPAQAEAQDKKVRANIEKKLRRNQRYSVSHPR